MALFGVMDIGKGNDQDDQRKGAEYRQLGVVT